MLRGNKMKLLVLDLQKLRSKEKFDKKRNFSIYFIVIMQRDYANETFDFASVNSSKEQ